MSRKIYLSPERRPAPHGPYAVGGVYEHDICNQIAELAKVELERQGFIVTIAPRAYTMEQRVSQANNGGYDYYMPIHSNAGGGTGAECLYYNHESSIKANQLVYNELVKLYPSKRGVKDYSHFYENRYTKMVSCYPEIAFHDNKADAEFILSSRAQIAQAFCKGVCAYFGMRYTEDADKDLYAVVRQVVALTGKEKAQRYADELNAKLSSDEKHFYKVIKV